MRLISFLSLAAVNLLLAACATPDQRIARAPEAFARYPAAVQEKIRAGVIEPGFTEEMVRFALGEPTRKLTRRTEQGEAEVWVYADNGPRFSFGVGVGGGSGGSGFAGGASISTPADDFVEKLRVEFVGGKVLSVEYRRK